MKQKIIVTQAIFPDLLKALEADFDVISNQENLPLSADELQKHLASVDGALVSGSDKIDAVALKNAAKLKIVANISVGYNNFNVSQITEKGILATNTPGILTETTADVAFGLLLAAARRFNETSLWVRAGGWTQKMALIDPHMGVDVSGTTLGIVGMGRIGQAVARRATAFGMKILYYNRSQLRPAIEKPSNATYLPLAHMLSKADHVVLTLPYSKESHHIIGKEQLALMKPTSTLVNVGRGGLIDEDALVEVLKVGKIFGAGLDVFEDEPHIKPGILALPNVFVTPHIGSATTKTRRGMVSLAIENLRAGLAGRMPPSLINPEVFTQAPQKARL